MELDYLVLLQYAQNVCYVQLVGLKRAMRKNPTLEVDLVNETWSWNEDGSNIRNIPIGKARYIEPNCRGGPIGIYDRREMGHLKNMVQDAINAVKEERFIED